MLGEMKIKSAGKTCLAVAVVLFMVIITAGCGAALINPLDQLATLRPVITPIPGGGETDPFIPFTNQSPTAPAPTSPPAATYTQLPQATPTPKESSTPAPPLLYYTQAGDTLAALAVRFGVDFSEISSPNSPIKPGFLDPGQLLLIPHRLGEISSPDHILPDSEIVFSPSALDFDLEKFINSTKGFLVTYKEWRANGRDDAANTIYRVAIENSINPRLLLAVLEYQSHWVYGQPANLAQTDYPLGHVDYQKKGLYYQLSWAVQMLNIGYYGWRDGRVTQLDFPDGKSVRLAPDLNAGTVSLLYLFAQLYDEPNWAGAMYSAEGLPALYKTMFGDPWVRALTVEPLFPATLSQPSFELPFARGKRWSFTGGPHSAWGPDGALASLDFAPSTTIHGCYNSDEYVTAMASGTVVRSETGVVVVDLDGDGSELTGWVIMYLHIATDGRLPVNTWVNQGDPIGHPSCEGGQATGTHVHVARKYNGEWIEADGPLPFELSGWIAHKGDAIYLGTLTKDSSVVTASVYGEYKSLITH
jgi:LasA protease